MAAARRASMPEAIIHCLVGEVEAKRKAAQDGRPMAKRLQQAAGRAERARQAAAKAAERYQQAQEQMKQADAERIAAEADLAKLTSEAAATCGGQALQAAPAT